ncbi:M64 family metallopeptidase [Thermoactinomyces sp. DSM 45892]|uniref:M64 family metallopeptidase n=1 Tax=Thermoactinomyces sp. DSM 45892 TaxID=1882753 RepID=UPI000896B166|nr:M64 family metallopeptidase [Thermoactinomyces sp. DSM 45892]SDZ32525.1 IgA Peptidase M64 [Thermoactinomyces sp. DSM 45892]
MRKWLLSSIVWMLTVILIASGMPHDASANKTAGENGQYLVVDLQKEGGKIRINKWSIEDGEAEGSMATPQQSELDPQTQADTLLIKDRTGKILYQTPFQFPIVRTVPPIMPGQKTNDHTPHQVPIKEPEVTLILPYFHEATTVEVKSSETKVTTQSMIPKSVQVDSHKKKVKPPKNNGKFEILLLPSGYDESSMDEFEQQVSHIKQAIQTTEPFASYLDKVTIHTIDESKPLGCLEGAQNIARLLVCNDTKVTSAAAHSGYGYDEIIVIHNTDNYGGSGMRDYSVTGFKTNSYSTYTVVYDGEWTARMAIHELGHSFGNLCDEYMYGDEGYSYVNCTNCRKDKSDLEKYVKGECSVGCDAKPDYFRAEDSIMLTLSIPTFNDVSIKADFAPYGLEKRLQFFTGTEQPKTVKRLQVDQTKVNLKPGEAIQLAVIATYEDGTKEDVAYVANWRASSEKKISLSQGYMRAISSGKVQVKASYGGKTVSVSVKIEAPKKLMVSEGEITLKSGERKDITVQAIYLDGTIQDVTQDVIWKTSKKRVATMEHGVIFAHEKGKAVLTGVYNGRVIKIYVRVNKL